MIKKTASPKIAKVAAGQTKGVNLSKIGAAKVVTPITGPASVMSSPAKGAKKLMGGY